MDKRHKFQKKKRIPMAIQRFNICKSFKSIIVEDNSRNTIDMVFKIKGSKDYFVKLKYLSLQDKPRIYLEKSQLINTEIVKIPHIYGIKTINGKEHIQLCLYYDKEWNATINISDSIIPWIIEWIYYYELWIITGQWLGGGMHPKTKDIKANK